MKFKWDVALAVLAVFGAIVFFGTIPFTLLTGKFIWSAVCVVAMCACAFAAAGILGGMIQQEEDEDEDLDY